MGFFERWRLNFLFLKDMFLTLDHGSTTKYIFQGIINISLITSWNVQKKKCLFCQVGWNLAHFYRVFFELKKNVFKFLCPCLDKLEFIVRYTRLKVLLNLYTRHNHCPQNFLPSSFSLIFLSRYIGLYALSRPRSNLDLTFKFTF